MATYRSTKCFQCGGVMLINVDVQTGHLHGSCSRCGRTTNVIRQQGKSGTEYTLEVDDHFGYGSMSLVFEDGHTYFGALKEPYNIEAGLAFDIAIRQDGIKTMECHMTRWDEGSKQVVSVYGTMPPLYEEWEKQQNATND